MEARYVALSGWGEAHLLDLHECQNEYYIGTPIHTIIVRVIVECVVNIRVLHIVGIEIGDGTTSRSNLLWVELRRRRWWRSVTFFSMVCGFRRPRWHLIVLCIIVTGSPTADCC